MKLTPEQQVFFRYGYVKAWLQSKILEARSYARRTYGEDYDKLTPEERADCRKECQIEFLIQRVRDRRAACRAWIPPQRRGCSTCKHDGTHYKLCALCHGVGWPISWKPKKEASND